MSIEVSQDSKHVFIAGASDFNIKKSKPVISVLKFDETFEEVNTLELSNKDMRMVNHISRLPKNDVLVVSGFKIMSIVEFRREELFELKQLRNIHSGNIYGFCLRGCDVFSVCPEDNFIHKF